MDHIGEERNKFENCMEQFSEKVQKKYSETETFYDGKCRMFDVEDDSLFKEMVALLAIKKAPNRKLTMCGYCCDSCKAFAGNIKKKDERKQLSDYWRRYYQLDIPEDEIHCDGCRCMKKEAVRVMQKKIENVGFK